MLVLHLIFPRSCSPDYFILFLFILIIFKSASTLRRLQLLQRTVATLAGGRVATCTTLSFIMHSCTKKASLSGATCFFFCVMTNASTLKYSFYDTNTSPDATADLGSVKRCHMFWLIDSVSVHSGSSQHFHQQLFSSEKALKRTTAFNLLSTYRQW